MTDQVQRLQPWMRGPFELIRHANGHLLDAGDTDRRIALIGFDNSIEVCIDVFIRLHPKLRGGYQVSRGDAENARQTFHSKIEFLDNYLAESADAPDIPIEAIVWYHQLRNELYHSGNGMVPEIHVIEGSRDAAIQVFYALFSVDISPALQGTPPDVTFSRDAAFITTGNVEMEFLRVFIDFERTLREFLLGAHYDDQAENLRFVPEMWRYYKNWNSTSNELDMVIESAFKIRNGITHGQSNQVDPESVVSIIVDLMELKAMLDDRT